MYKKEIVEAIIVSSIIIIVFIVAVIAFIFQYRKRKLAYLNETMMLNKKHNEELLSAQLDTQQQTMQYIGTEIHDNIGQKLTLASLYIKQLSAKNAADTGIKAAAIGAIIDDSLSELRQLSKTLTNPQLANADLTFLLQEEAARIHNSRICHLAVSGGETTAILSPHKKNMIFRLLQEFIQNSLKHSGCRKIHIDIRTENEVLTINASDDGKGFDTGTTSDGIGLKNMQHRAELLNAIYTLHSESGKGTSLFLQLAVY